MSQYCLRLDEADLKRIERVGPQTKHNKVNPMLDEQFSKNGNFIQKILKHVLKRRNFTCIMLFH